jgi:nucleoid-associated protein YgaU
MSRFRNRRVGRLKKELYSEMLEERDVRYIDAYETPNFTYPTPENLRELVIKDHIWKKGDRYFKLAHEHYGDSKLWWVIAWYNKKPTEAHVSLGDIIRIPTPVGRVLSYMGNR